MSQEEPTESAEIREGHKPRRRYKTGVRYRDSGGRIYYAEPSGALRRLDGGKVGKAARKAARKARRAARGKG